MKIIDKYAKVERRLNLKKFKLKDKYKKIKKPSAKAIRLEKLRLEDDFMEE